MSPEHDLVIVGDEAYTAEEWERLERRREKDRIRYRTDPERRAKVLAAAHRWNAAHPEEYREIRNRAMQRRRADPEYRALELVKNAEAGRRKRAEQVRVPNFSLHDLRCTGPTRATGCRCKKVMRIP